MSSMHPPLLHLKLGIAISLSIVVLLGAAAWMSNTAVARGMVAPPEFKIHLEPLQVVGIVTDDPRCPVPTRVGAGSVCNTFSLYREQHYYVLWFGYNRRTEQRPHWAWSKLLVTALPQNR